MKMSDEEDGFCWDDDGVEVLQQPSGTAKPARNKGPKSTEHKKKEKIKPKKKKLKKPPAKTDSAPTATSETDNDIQSEVDLSAWKDLFVPEPVLRGLSDSGFATPTPIQALTLPAAIRDRMDILGAAETGSGKTLAFGIPVLHKVLEDLEKPESEDETNDFENSDNEEDTEDSENDDDMRIGCVRVIDDVPMSVFSTGKSRKSGSLKALIVTPTRELAVQIKKHLEAAAKYTSVRIAVVVGGLAPQKQERLLKRRPHIVIGTPGRLWQLIEEGNEHLCQVPMVRCLVIDEADRMLEKGHFAELSNILELMNGDEECKKRRQTFVFSATLTLVHDLPKRLLAKKRKKKMTQERKLENLMSTIGMREQHKVIDVTRKLGIAETLTESRIHCNLQEKDAYLYYFIQRFPGRTLVFCNSIDCVRRLTTVMTLLKCNVYPLHANMHQKQRLKHLEQFTRSSNGLLIATDVAQRGLDIPGIEHVIHYQVPRTSEAYIHRSGRTARASHQGITVMMIEPNEIGQYRKLCKTLNRDADLPHFPIDRDILNAVTARVDLARELDKAEHWLRRKRSNNNWFAKASEELEIELDEDALLENLGDDEEQAQRKRSLKHLQKRLNSALKTPIRPGNRPNHITADTVNLMVQPLHKEKAIHVIRKENETTNLKRRKQNKRFIHKKRKTV